jgi:hypothetical protein
MITVDAWEGDVPPLPLDWFAYICLSTGTGSNTHLHVDLQFSHTLLFLTTLSSIEISDFDLC